MSVRDGISAPYIYLGFQRPLERRVLRQAVLDQDLDPVFASLDKITVRPGDVFLVPGGLPHAIGAGIFMIEIMEPTDYVVRLEFECGGYVLPEESRFMGRDVDFAMDLIDFTPRSVQELQDRFFCRPVLLESQKRSQEWSLVDPRYTDCFRVKRLRVRGTFEKREPSFYVAVVATGAGSILTDRGSLEVKFGDKFFVPFATDFIRFVSRGGMDIVSTLPPDS